MKSYFRVSLIALICLFVSALGEILDVNQPVHVRITPGHRSTISTVGYRLPSGARYCATVEYCPLSNLSPLEYFDGPFMSSCIRYSSRQGSSWSSSCTTKNNENVCKVSYKATFESSPAAMCGATSDGIWVIDSVKNPWPFVDITVDYFSGASDSVDLTISMTPLENDGTCQKAMSTSKCSPITDVMFMSATVSMIDSLSKTPVSAFDSSNLRDVGAAISKVMNINIGSLPLVGFSNIVVDKSRGEVVFMIPAAVGRNLDELRRALNGDYTIGFFKKAIANVQITSVSNELPEKYKFTGLSAGAIAGIVIGVFAIVFLSLGGAAYYRRRRYGYIFVERPVRLY